jgi:hypothetical protein
MSDKAFSIGVAPVGLALPTGTATITMFDSVATFGAKGLRNVPLCRVAFGVEHDQGFTVVASRSIDGGATWDVIDSQAVSVVANTIAGPFDYLIDTYDDFRIQITNGGTDQTVWKPELHGYESRASGT